MPVSFLLVLTEPGSNPLEAASKKAQRNEKRNYRSLAAAAKEISANAAVAAFLSELVRLVLSF